MPIIEEIDSCPWCNSQEKEIYYIKYYKELGCNLVNSTDGGEGNLGLVKSPESIERLRKSLLKESPPVYQYSLSGEFIDEFENVSEAARILKINYAGLLRCAQGKRKKYQNFQWSFDKLDRLPEYCRKNVTVNKGYSQSDLAKLIKLEENSLIVDNIYIFKNDFSKENFLYEAITLRDAAKYIIGLKITNSSEDNLRNKICQCCLSQTPYLGKYFFTKDKPNFISKPKSSFLLGFDVFNLKDELIYSVEGLDKLTNYLDVKKSNIINNIKGVTKSLNYNNQKIYIKWRKL